MSHKTRNPAQHTTATTVSDGSRRASEGQAAKAIALLNYTQALQEHLEEQLPGTWTGRGVEKPVQSLAGHLVALDALGLITSLLAAVGAGKQVDGAEFKTVLTQARAAFAESGMVGGDRLAPANFQTKEDATAFEGFGWSLPQWCIEKLCHGVEELSSDIAEDRGEETQT